MRKLALVTAGTSAIGRHLVRALAETGYLVAYSHLPGEAAPPATAEDVLLLREILKLLSE